MIDSAYRRDDLPDGVLVGLHGTDGYVEILAWPASPTVS